MDPAALTKACTAAVDIADELDRLLVRADKQLDLGTDHNEVVHGGDLNEEEFTCGHGSGISNVPYFGQLRGSDATEEGLASFRWDQRPDR